MAELEVKLMESANEGKPAVEVDFVAELEVKQMESAKEGKPVVEGDHVV